MGEGVEPGRELAAVGKGDTAVADLLELNALAVDETGCVRLEQQPVTRGHFQLAGLTHIEGGGGTAGNKIHLSSIGTAHTQTVLDRGDDFHGFASLKAFGLANEAQTLARLELV